MHLWTWVMWSSSAKPYMFIMRILCVFTFFIWVYSDRKRENLESFVIFKGLCSFFLAPGLYWIFFLLKSLVFQPLSLYSLSVNSWFLPPCQTGHRSSLKVLTQACQPRSLSIWASVLPCRPIPCFSSFLGSLLFLLCINVQCKNVRFFFFQSGRTVGRMFWKNLFSLGDPETEDKMLLPLPPFRSFTQ